MKHIVLFTAYCLLLTLFSCKTQEELTPGRNVKLNKTYTTDSGLQYVFTNLGEGARAKNGDKVSVHYIGKLTDGKEFDNSYKRGTPFSFTVGQGKVIKGWDEGIGLLNVGDKAVFTIPAELGYGPMAVPGLIPANSTLIFEVELLSIEAGY
ncbi:MAG: putative FKBP-type peptidyl-prolyl cis-trans isomerase [Bacteroidia bacterium]|nr:putative FKBP-type peptidyl-prolyl cis-trans isomerase [Bacteroidia bacterium]